MESESEIIDTTRENATGSAAIVSEASNTLYKSARSVMDLIGSTGETKATPIRNPASAFFNINSIDRYASANNPTSQFALLTQPAAISNSIPASNYHMSLQRNLLTGYFHRLTVSEINLQWNIPTINSQNYILSITADSPAAILLRAQLNTPDAITNANVSLICDFYNYDELAAELQRAIRLAFTSLTPNLDALTVVWQPRTAGGAGYNFTFNTNTDVTIEFNTVIDEEQPFSLIPGQTVNQATRAMFKLYTMLGITEVILHEPKTILATQPSYPTLIYTSYFDIISSKLSQFMRVKDSETSWSPDTAVITRVYLSNINGISAPVTTQTGTTTFETFAIGSRPFVLNYAPTTVKNINWSPGQSIIDFDIRVVDEFGDLLPWSLNTTQPGGGKIYFTEVFEFQMTALASET